MIDMKKWLRRLLLVLLVFAGLMLIGPFLVPVPELEGLQPPEALAGESSQFTTIPFAGTDGIKIHFRQDGRGGPTLILLHGFSSSLYTWDGVFDFFVEQGTTYAYDRPPFGLSERLLRGDWDQGGPNPYTTAAAVEQLRALMDAQGIEQAVLVGHSAGGLIALQAAQDYPQRVQGLVLVDPAVYTSGAPTWLGAVANTPQLRRLGPLVARAFAGSDRLRESAYYEPERIPPATLEKAAIGTRVEDWDKAFWQFTAAASSAEGIIARIGTVTAPTLVVTGEADQIVPPEESARLATALPNASLVTIPACGHVPHEECPEQFKGAVAAWLGRQSFW